MIKIQAFVGEHLLEFKKDLQNSVTYAVEIRNLVEEGFDETIQYEIFSTRNAGDQTEHYFWQRAGKIFFAIEDKFPQQKLVGVVVVEATLSKNNRSMISEVHISGLSIHKDFRRQNIATLLLDDVITWAKLMKASTISVDVAANNAPAIALYSKLGLVTARMFMQDKL